VLSGVGGDVEGADVYEGVKLEFGPAWRFGFKSRLAAHPSIPPHFAVLGHRDFFNCLFVGFDAGEGSFFVSEPRRRANAH